MNTKIAGCLITYGGFLMGLGFLGYWSNPEEAKTASMAGGTFGAFAIHWGVLGARGVRCSLPAAITTTGLLAVGFAWLAAWGWLAVLAGQSEKLFAVVLMTTILAGSGLMLRSLLKAG